MISLESDKMTDLCPSGSLTFTFYKRFSNSILDWEILKKEVFDLMIGVESAQRTVLWPNDHLSFTFYLI